MTTIKIPFTKKSLRRISASELAPGTKGLELKIQTNFLMSQLCSLENIHGGPITDVPFKKIAFVFKDDSGQLIYDSLNENQNFELIFEIDKVWLNVDGFGNIIDKTKPEVHMQPGDKSLVIFFETKFAGIITLESKDNEDNPNEDNPPSVIIVRNYCKKNGIKKLSYDEATDKLIIEYKQNKPNKELTKFSGKSAELKKYLLKKGKVNGTKRNLLEEDWEREYQNTQVQKTDYTPYLIGGGVIIVAIFILAIVGLNRRNDR